MNDESGSGLSAQIARHIAQSRYENLPGTTIAAAKRAILDGVGVILAASGTSEDVLPFVDLARAQEARRKPPSWDFANG